MGRTKEELTAYSFMQRMLSSPEDTISKADWNKFYQYATEMGKCIPLEDEDKFDNYRIFVLDKLEEIKRSVTPQNPNVNIGSIKNSVVTSLLSAMFTDLASSYARAVSDSGVEQLGNAFLPASRMSGSHAGKSVRKDSLILELESIQREMSKLKKDESGVGDMTVNLAELRKLLSQLNKRVSVAQSNMKGEDALHVKVSGKTRDAASRFLPGLEGIAREKTKHYRPVKDTVEKLNTLLTGRASPAANVTLVRDDPSAQISVAFFKLEGAIDSYVSFLKKDKESFKLANVGDYNPFNYDAGKRSEMFFQIMNRVIPKHKEMLDPDGYYTFGSAFKRAAKGATLLDDELFSLSDTAQHEMTRYIQASLDKIRDLENPEEKILVLSSIGSKEDQREEFSAILQLHRESLAFFKKD